MVLHCIVVGLKFVVRLCTDLGLKDAQEYIQKLKKAEKAHEVKQHFHITYVIQITNISIVVIIQRELSGGRKHSGRAPSDSGS